MTDEDLRVLEQQMEERSGALRGLQMSVYSQPDPASQDERLAELAQAEGELEELRQRLAAARAVPEAVPEAAPETVSGVTRGGIAEKTAMRSGAAQRGRFLGAATTGLSVAVKLRMDPVPTGAYHLMDPETDPLLTVEVENASREIRRILVKAFIEGLSAQAVRTIEIEPKSNATFDLQPTLFPERTHAITEVQRATLHVIVEDLDGKLERHNTYPLTCLARTASFNAVRRPDTGEMVDLSHYYGAWVTPHVEPVQELIRRSVELCPERQMLGYQGDPDLVSAQVSALYQSLREADIVYINSVIDYGAPTGMTTQRTRLPRESLARRSANCIDGTVLMASLLEGISLNPAIVLVPGHALLAWEVWHGANEWNYLETTLISKADFEVACQSGKRQCEQFMKFSRNKMKRHSLRDLRERGIWPME